MMLAGTHDAVTEPEQAADKEKNRKDDGEDRRARRCIVDEQETRDQRKNARQQIHREAVPAMRPERMNESGGAGDHQEHSKEKYGSQRYDLRRDDRHRPGENVGDAQEEKPSGLVRYG